MNANNKFKTSLAKVQKLGAAGNGTDTWIKQRISAVFLIPFVMWFVIMLVKITIGDANEIHNIISSPLNGIIFILLTIISIYHGTIGFKEIIEDYIHCKTMKNTMVILLYFMSIITAVTLFSAVLIFQISSF
jgi:succinate dehydrogenase / fumarate reductase, membrane anchor subunit